MSETIDIKNERFTSQFDREPGDELALNGFFSELREAELRVSPPEWLSFVAIVKSLDKSQLQDSNFFYTLKQIAQVTLIKDNSDIALFSEVFDRFFIAPTDQSVTEQKEQLDIDEVQPNQLDDLDHDDNDVVHGGQIDQHNDILNQQDATKIGGGDQQPNADSQTKQDQDASNKNHDKTNNDGNKEQNQDEQFTGSEGGKQGGTGQGEGDQEGSDNNPASDSDDSDDGDGQSSGSKPSWNEKEAVEQAKRSGGKGNAQFNMGDQPIVITSKTEFRKQPSESLRQADHRNRYERRPNQNDMQTIISKLRKKIITFSKNQQKDIHIERTVNNFAQKNFQIDYKAEQDQQPDIVLLMDVGGPVDQFRPLVEELATKMTSGLTKLQIYFFHNQLYGYVWPQKDGNAPQPNSLLNIKDLITKNKKVIIYGDAQMSNYELHEDNWQPAGNTTQIKNYTMGGLQCLKYIKQKADTVVWINPFFRKDWAGNRSTDKISDIIEMFDLSVGGFEDSITHLIDKQ